MLVPEVVQTSAMDCGPAALKCLLDGFHMPVSYGRLREACQTSVDGTSIDTLEDVAVQLGLEAEQIMVPVDHVLLPEAQTLPALVVLRLADGNTHFVVAWRRHGRFVQVMDPASGRRWPTCRQFLDALYVHSMPIPAAAWLAWAGSDECLDVLHRRLGWLGLSRRTTTRLLTAALEDQEWRSLATLDAALRMVTALVRAGGLGRGQQAGRVLEACLADTAPDPADDLQRLPVPYWSVRPAASGPEGEAQLLLRGAVLVRIRGRRAVDPTVSVNGLSEPGSEPSPLSPELVAALEEPPSRPGRVLLQLLCADGLLTPTVLVAALFLTAAGLVVEGLLWRGLIDLGRDLGLTGQRLGGMGMVLVFSTVLLVLELGVTGGVLRAGRQLEVRLRLAFLAKIPRLGDRYFHSRLTSDMAERSHSLHRIRLLPELGGQLLLVSCELVLTTAGIAWLDPASAPLAVLTAALAVGVPLAAQPLLAERDFRVRTHVGALSRFYLDTLLGLVAIRTHGAAPTIQGAHAQLLGEWTRASVESLRAVVTVEGVQFFLSFGLVVWLLFDYYGRGGEASVVLLLIYWTLNLPVHGQEIALLARQYPAHRNITLRLLEPLGALEEHQARMAPSPLVGEGGTLNCAPSADAVAGNGWDGGTEAMAAPASPLASPPPLPSPIEGEGTEAAGSAINDLNDVLKEATGQTRSLVEGAQDEDSSVPTQVPQRATGTWGVAITLEEVHVQVAGHTVLAGINLTIAPGSHVAIVGPSGAGKSSLVGTLLGWYRPASGEVRIDGVPFDSERLAQLRRETAWVDPAVQLWNRSLLDNLSYGAPADLSLPIGQVIAQAHLRSVLERLPEGLQTRLGEGGALISGGEGQRVRLGRAMFRPGVRLVILDEPCRGLDREQRQELLARARQLWRQATLLCITHDVGETQAFDRVLVMDGGRIVEDGTPADLAAQAQSRYRALLDAEVAVRQGLWSHGRWRRLWLNAGRLVEDERREDRDERSEATVVAGVQAGRGSGGTRQPEWPLTSNGAAPAPSTGPETGQR
jgi:ABC-type bacteriocin/lantibiotic exporter with double-glycine peptidase domain